MTETIAVDVARPRRGRRDAIAPGLIDGRHDRRSGGVCPGGGELLKARSRAPERQRARGGGRRVRTFLRSTARSRFIVAGGERCGVDGGLKCLARAATRPPTLRSHARTPAHCAPSKLIQIEQRKEYDMSNSRNHEQVEKVSDRSARDVRRGPRARSADRTTLEALDIDPLDLAELSQMVEEQYGVNLTSSDVTASRRSGTPSIGSPIGPTETAAARRPRRSSSPASAPSRRSASARARCTSAGAAGDVRDLKRRGPLRRLRPERLPLRQGGAPRRPLHAARDRRVRRGAGRRRLARRERPYDPERVGWFSAPASAASARSSTARTRCASAARSTSRRCPCR